MQAFIPTLPVVFALFASITLPLILLALSRGAIQVNPPGKRFKLACLVSIGVWAIGVAISDGSTVVDIACSGLIVATAILVVFSFWSLLAYGFTTWMLLSLFDCNRSLSMRDWMSAYCATGLDGFASDRLQVLLKLGMVRVSADKSLLVTVRGKVFGNLAWFGIWLFAINPDKEI